MELSILHAIQTIHNPVLDKIMVLVFNNLVGSLGQLWIVVGVVLLLIPKTRKCGAAVLLSYALSLLIGNEWLKDWIARPRPCAVDDTVALIVKKPSSFSCPSVHTYLAFSSAMAIFHYYKKNGHRRVCICGTGRLQQNVFLRSLSHGCVVRRGSGRCDSLCCMCAAG